MGLFKKIFIDYQAMRQKAAELEELADELKSIAQNQVACYAANKSFWQGDSGDACRQKLRKLEKNLNSRAKLLQRVAKALRIVAATQYNLEMSLVALVSK